MAAKKNEPVHQYRLGRIVGTVWFNDDDNGHGRHWVSINRLYKPNDEDGWQRLADFLDAVALAERGIGFAVRDVHTEATVFGHHRTFAHRIGSELSERALGRHALTTALVDLRLTEDL